MPHDDSSALPDRETLERGLEALPLFPLPGVVLFPHALLPLHVFEPRYRALLAHCLSTHRMMAVPLLPDPDAVDPAGQPVFAKVAGLGVIVEHEALEDGRANIVLRGVARVDLDERPAKGPFREARARVREEISTEVSDDDRTALSAAAAALVGELRKRANVSLPFPPDAPTSVLIDLCAAHLVADPAVRQAVLEDARVDDRLRRVTTEIAMQHRFLLERTGGVLH